MAVLVICYLSRLLGPGSGNLYAIQGAMQPALCRTGRRFIVISALPNAKEVLELAKMDGRHNKKRPAQGEPLCNR